MPATISGVVSEQEWCEFLRLRPKVLHALGEYEVEAHDLYMLGKVTTTNVFLFSKGDMTWSEMVGVES